MKHLGIFRAGIAILAAATTVGAQAADAQTSCLSESEIAALTIDVMPQLVSATETGCKSQLAQDGFLATEGTAMAQRYAARADEVWPQAKSAFLKFSGGSKGKDADAFRQLPDSALRPLFDGIITQEIAKEIHPKSCHDIERLAKVLSRLDPDTTGALVSVIASLAIGDKEKPKVCEAQSS